MGFSRSAMWRTAYAIPPLLVTIKFGYTVGSIEGRSMQPHFNPDTSGTRRDIVLLDRYSPMSGHYNHGDVVILTAPHNPEMKLVKRIVGLGGDAVRPRSGAQEGIGV
ncbi:hypothetical protein PhCBS80983_g02770 [Powellomyces hirtus]|uniref:Mitochondrial inner membrane protease subunit n=1 Tax=Powellomyces hirtus TaxID=109895 RepID=A0A507E4G5_9FUNG|nr:hypothetical protein PhCBS80983_g02770 [Powellomyces hirtus]